MQIVHFVLTLNWAVQQIKNKKLPRLVTNYCRLSYNKDHNVLFKSLK